MQRLYIRGMKRLFNYFRLWRYRRLYHRLFLLYAEKTDNSWNARYEASQAFLYMTGFDYDDLLSSKI